jgi:hypothetical protein
MSSASICSHPVNDIVFDALSRTKANCLLALDCCLVDIRNCGIIIPSGPGKVAVHACQALLRMQHCNVSGGCCSVLASHNAIGNISDVHLGNIDAVALAAGSAAQHHLKPQMFNTAFQYQAAVCSRTQSKLNPSDSLHF